MENFPVWLKKSTRKDVKNFADIHFYYTKETSESAMKVRENLKKNFPKLRFFDPLDEEQAKKIFQGENEGNNPHTTSMWEADFGNYDEKTFAKAFGEAVYFLMLNRNGHSVLIHPHTQDAKSDHLVHPIWLGKPQALNAKAFENH